MRIIHQTVTKNVCVYAISDGMKTNRANETKKTENKWKQQNKYETLSSGRKRTSIESILVN